MKAVLVLNEMPSSCGECPLCNTSNNDDYCCDIIGDVDGEYDGKDQRCPLKPMPDRRYAIQGMIGYEGTKRECKGYNRCIDEILGE